MDTMETMDVYVFSEDAPYDVIDDLRRDGMPPHLRYAASVTGPWRVFAIYEVERLSELPSLTRGGGIGSETAVARARYLKKSVYHEVGAFVRVHLGNVDPGADTLDGSSVLEAIREIVQDPSAMKGEGEAESAMGGFDILAYVGGDDPSQVAETIGRIRRVQGVRKTVSMGIIDYVSTNPDAGDHYVAPRGGSQTAS